MLHKNEFALHQVRWRPKSHIRSGTFKEYLVKILHTGIKEEDIFFIRGILEADDLCFSDYIFIV